MAPLWFLIAFLLAFLSYRWSFWIIFLKVYIGTIWVLVDAELSYQDLMIQNGVCGDRVCLLNKHPGLLSLRCSSIRYRFPLQFPFHQHLTKNQPLIPIIFLWILEAIYLEIPCGCLSETGERLLLSLALPRQHGFPTFPMTLGGLTVKRGSCQEALRWLR